MIRQSLVLLGTVLAACVGLAGAPTRVEAQGVPATQPAPAAEEPLPVFLRDRGTGLPTSMFGTYVRKGELLVYPFFEGYVDRNLEYSPAELGFGLDAEYRGRYRAAEGLVFLGYGVRDWLAVEFEASVIRARLDTDPTDPTNVPTRIAESGVGDIEGQVRARWLRETTGRPEVFSYFEAVTPNGGDRLLIGTPDWELKVGSGIVKGSAKGTFTVRAAVEYSKGEGKWEPGEYAVEYLKRLSPQWRVFAGIEGAQDEVELITELQWHPSDRMFFKFNNGFGLTSKATDWAPEVGIVWSFPTRRSQ
jgi:hypothetical protein